MGCPFPFSHNLSTSRQCLQYTSFECSMLVDLEQLRHLSRSYFSLFIWNCDSLKLTETSLLVSYSSYIMLALIATRDGWEIVRIFCVGLISMSIARRLALACLTLELLVSGHKSGRLFLHVVIPLNKASNKASLTTKLFRPPLLLMQVMMRRCCESSLDCRHWCESVLKALQNS